MGAALPTYNGLDQNYDFIYDALLEGATVYLRISNYFGDGLTTMNALVTEWILYPYDGLLLKAVIEGDVQYFGFSNGSYHTKSDK